ncbi:WG repeat-containing protein [Hymenobacter daeguensis]
MVHCFLASPFADAGRTQQFAAIRAALQADAGPATLLLGNLVLEDGAAPLDAVVVRPHSITLLLLVPDGGHLSIPALGYGSWLLNGAALPGTEDFDNPFEQFRTQKPALEAWLRPRFSTAQANLSFITGMVMFRAPADFDPDVEAALSDAPAGFQLLGQPADLPRRLRQLATPEIDLTPQDIAEWAAEWAEFAAAAPAAPVPDAPRPAATAASVAAGPAVAAASTFLGQKARALWGWLGASDVPDDDPPYGYAAALSARSEEKEQLEQLRQQMQADLHTQLSALEAREAERERNIAQLRAELAQAPPVAAEATALVSRLGAETREKAALEAEMQASRAELAARNQELDAKIQQLGQLIEQLNKTAAASPPPAQAAPPPARPVSPPAPPTATAPAATAAADTAAPAAATAAPSSNPTNPAASPRPDAASAALAAKVSAGSIAAGPVAAGSFAAAAQKQWGEWQKRGAAFGARLLPQLRRAGEWGRAQPKAALAVAGAAVLALGVWGLGHGGRVAPVPYQENGRWGYANASGEPVIKAQYTEASPFRAGQAVVAKDGAYGLVDEQGHDVIAPAYDALNPYSEGFARARVGDTYTFIDEDGQEFDHYYYNALDFAEGYAAVLDHRGWHYIKGAEEPEKPVIFKEAYAFSGGLARVRLRDGYTFINPAYLDDPSRGTKPFGRYQLAADFADGKARVMQHGRRFVIDKDGEEVK